MYDFHLGKELNVAMAEFRKGGPLTGRLKFKGILYFRGGRAKANNLSAKRECSIAW